LNSKFLVLYFANYTVIINTIVSAGYHW